MHKLVGNGTVAHDVSNSPSVSKARLVLCVVCIRGVFRTITMHSYCSIDTSYE